MFDRTANGDEKLTAWTDLSSLTHENRMIKSKETWKYQMKSIVIYY